MRTEFVTLSESFNRPVAFYFHYNKPLSQKLKRPVASIHYSTTCIFVEDVMIHGMVGFISTRRRSRQPRWVVQGKMVSLEIEATRQGDATVYVAHINRPILAKSS
jgi:hypothetical protein